MEVSSTMARIVDVARLAGVAPSVVSRLLNADPTLRIREQTRHRIEKAAVELNYTANSAARALRRARSGVIGLAVRDLHNPVYAEIFAGAQARAQQRGLALLVADLDGLAADPAAFAQLSRDGSIDGLLLQRDGTIADALLTQAADARLPVVVLNERVTAPLSGVAVDDVAGARLATKHLIALGHKEIGHLQAGGTTSRARDRRRGWASALREASIDPNGQSVVNGGARPESGQAAMREMLSLSRPPTAIFAGTLLSAIGAMTMARSAGIDIPGELSIVGFHDGWFAEHVAPSLTVVRMPLRELGAAAVTLLVDPPASAAAHRMVISDPPPELIHRGSSAPPAHRRRRG